MTDNLALSLTAGTQVVASKNDGTTFSFTPTACNTNGACAMNGNTALYNGNGYYSWYAATAGVGDANFVGDPDGSICPRGWKFPSAYIHNYDRSYRILYDSYGLTSGTTTGVHNVLKAFPFSFTNTGYFSDGAIVGWTSEGGYYLGASAIVYSADGKIYAFGLAFATNQTWSGWVYDKYVGYAARCVAL